MKKDYILVIDSGIGGLSTLSEIVKVFPFNYIYFADNINSPYGSHSSEEVFEFLCNIIDSETKKYNIKMVVLACNTATTTNIEKLRNKYKNLTIIGTEPAIKLASKTYDRFILLATPLTCKQNKVRNLIISSKKQVKIVPKPALARAVDEFLTEKSYFSCAKILQDAYKTAKIASNYDAIVFGCTHYCFLYDIFRKITNVPILDGNKGVASRIKFLATKIGYNAMPISSVAIKLSKNTNFAKQNYKKIFRQILAKNQRLC